MPNYFDKYDDDPVAEVQSSPKSNYFDKYDEPEQAAPQSNYFDKYDEPAEPGPNTFEDPSYGPLRVEEEPTKAEGRPVTPAPERSLIGDIGQSIGMGAVDTWELAGQALKTIGADETGQHMVDTAMKMGESELLRPDESQAYGRDGAVHEGILGGLRSMGPSLGSRVLGAAAGIATTAGIGALTGTSVGPVGTIIGAIAGATVGTGALFGLGIYGQAKDEAAAKGLSVKDQHNYGMLQAVIEGGIESATVIPEMALFAFSGGTSTLASQPLKQTVKSLLKQPLSKLVRNYAASMGIEVSTEVIQEGLGNEVAKKYGLSEIPTDEAMLKAIIPAMTMSVIFGMGSQGYTSMQRRSMTRTLADPKADPQKRADAAKMVFQRLVKQDEELAIAWAQYADQKIMTRQPLEIDQTFASYGFGRVEDEDSIEEQSGPIVKAETAETGTTQIVVAGKTGEQVDEQTQEELTVQQLTELSPEELQGIREEAQSTNDTAALALVDKAERRLGIQPDTQEQAQATETGTAQTEPLVQAETVDIADVAAAMPGTTVTQVENSEGKKIYVVETRGGQTIEIEPGKNEIKITEKGREGETALGSFTFDGSKGLIQLIDDPEVLGTLDHEVYHGAERMVLTPREIRILKRKYGDEEGRAEAYRLFREGRGSARDRTIFQKIFDFVQGLVNNFMPTASGTMKQIESGKVWKRETKVVDKSTKKSTKTGVEQGSKRSQKLSPKLRVRDEGAILAEIDEGVFFIGGDMIDIDFKGNRAASGIRYPEIAKAWTAGKNVVDAIDKKSKQTYKTIAIVAYPNVLDSMRVNPIFHAALKRELQDSYGTRYANRLLREAKKKGGVSTAQTAVGMQPTKAEAVALQAEGKIPKNATLKRVVLKSVAENIAVEDHQSIAGKVVGVGRYKGRAKPDEGDIYSDKILFDTYVKFDKPVPFSDIVNELSTIHGGSKEMTPARKLGAWLMLRNGAFWLNKRESKVIPAMIKAGKADPALVSELTDGKQTAVVAEKTTTTKLRTRKGKGPQARDYEPPTTKAGVYKGVPPGIKNKKDLNRMRRFIAKLQREGEVGRFWYEDSAKKILDIANGNVAEAEIIMQLIAIYSQQAKVDSNTYFAIKAWDMYKRGVDPKDFHIRTKAQDKKAINVLYNGKPWSGRKTNSFYLNLMNWIYENRQADFQKLGLDVETVENIKQPVTVDMWMYRAYGYRNDGYGDDKDSGAYSFVENEVKRLADLTGWTPHQSQAAIWTAMKARYEDPSVKDATWQESFKKGLATKNEKNQWMVPKTIEGLQKHRAIWRKHAMKLTSAQSAANAREWSADYSTFIDRATSVVTWEALPSLSLNINIRNPKVFTEKARAIIFDGGRDLLAEQLGIPFAYARPSTGGYEGAVNENTLSHLIPVKASGDFTYDQVRQYALALQYIFRQDAVPFYRADSRVLLTAAGRKALKWKVVNPATGRTKRTFDTQLEAEKYAAEKGGEIRGGSYSTGASVRFGRELDRQTENKVIELLQQYIHPEAAFTKVSADELEIINFRDDETKIPITVSDETFRANLEALLQEHGEELDVVEQVEFYSEGEYGHYQEWGKDPEGKQIQAQGSWPRSSGVQAWIQGRREIFDGLLAEEGNASRDSGVPKYRTREGSQRTDERGVPLRPDGRVGLFHYSKTEGLKELDPAMHGTGLRGAESKRKASDPKNWVDRTYYGIAGGNYKKEPGLGSKVYHTSLPPGDLYDFGQDPLNLIAQAQKEREANPFLNNVNIYERLIKEAGYDGYFANQGDNGLVAAVYSKQIPESEQVRYAIKGERKTIDTVPPGLEELRDMVAKRIESIKIRKTLVDAKAGKVVLSNLLNKKGHVVPSRVASKFQSYEKLIAKLQDRTLSVEEKLKLLYRYLVDEAPPGVRGHAHIQTILPQIAAAKTEKRRLQLMNRAIRRLDELNDAQLRRESIAKIRNLLKQKALRKKGGINRQVSGGFELFDELREIKKVLAMTKADALAEYDRLFSLIDSGQEFTEEQLIELEKLEKRKATGEFRKGDRMRYETILADSNAVKLTRLSTYGFLSSRTGTEARQAYEQLRGMIDEKTLIWMDQVQRLREQRRKEREEAGLEIRGGEAEKTDAQERLERDKRKKGWAALKDQLRGYDDKQQSWEWLLDKMARFAGKAPLASTLVRRYGRLVNRATSAELKGLGEQFGLIQAKMAEIWGVPVKQLSKIRRQDADVKEKTGVYVYNDKGEQVYEVPLSQNEAYKRWMELQDQSLRESLAPTDTREGWTDESIEQLEEYMTDEIRSWAEWQLNEFYDEYYDSINPVYRELFFTDLAKVINYSPIAREYDKGGIDENLLKQNTPHSSVLNSAVKSRTQSDRSIKVQDGDAVLAQHISQMEHFKAWGVPMRELRSVLGSEHVRKAVRQFHGQTAVQTMDNFLDDFARGKVHERFQSKMAMWFRRNFTTAAIGLNPIVFMKQLTSIPAYAMDMPMGEWAKRLPASPGQMRKAIKVLMSSDLMKARYDIGFERDMILAMAKRGAMQTAGGKNLADKMMFLTKWGDRAAIIYGGWPVYSYYHEQGLKAGMTEAEAHKEAIERFEETTARTQQAGQLKDLNQYQRGGAFAQMFTMFYTAPSAYYRSWMGGIRQLQGLNNRQWRRILSGRGTAIQKQAAKRVFIGQVVLPSIFMWISNGGEWDDKDMLKAILLGPLTGMFLLRDFGLAGYNFLTGERNFSDPGLPPMFSTAGEAERAFSKTKRHLSNFTEMTLGEWILDKDMWEAVQSVGTTAGNLSGYPVGPASRTLEGMYDSAISGATVAPKRRFLGYSESKLDSVYQDYMSVRKSITAKGESAKGYALLKSYEKVRRDYNRQIRNARGVSRAEMRELFDTRAQILGEFLETYQEL